MRFRRVGKLPVLLISIAAVLLTAAAPAYAAGELDTSFGAGAGVVSTLISPTAPDFAAGGPVLVLPSGKIILAGTDGADLVLVRYLSDGTVDNTSFGTSGIARLTAPAGCPSTGDSVAINALIRQSADDKLVLGGSWFDGCQVRPFIARFNGGGTPDTGFDSDGFLSFDLSGSILGLAADSTNITAVGNPEAALDPSFLLFRVSATDGTPDASFTGPPTGTKTVSIPGAPTAARAFDLKLVTGSEIMVAGSGNDGTETKFLLALLKPTGVLDTTFGGGTGFVQTSFPAPHIATALSMFIGGDGSIELAGRSGGGSPRNFALAKYNSDGSIDSSFGSGGIATSPFPFTDPFDYARDSAGRVVGVGQYVTGATCDGCVERFAVARFTAAGALDPDFGCTGEVITDFGHRQQGSQAVAIDAGDNILAGGAFDLGPAAGSGRYPIALARYLGAPASACGGGGGGGGGEGGAGSGLSPPPDSHFVLGAETPVPGGSAKVTVTVPGPGELDAHDAGAGSRIGRAAATVQRPALIRPTSITATKAGPVTLVIKPSSYGKKQLRKHGKLRVRVKITFTPTGGTASSKTITLKLVKH